jgi:hypothetical protein
VSWINVGARVNGDRPKTKAGLKRAITANPKLVQFDVTGMVGPRHGSMSIDATAEDIGADKLSVTGPDPYTSRRWYATVEVRNGRIQLS